MKKDYVSFEVAKLLKEKGFKWPCQAFYTSDRALILSPVHTINDELCGSDIACPTLAMAHKWLREEYSVYILIKPHYAVEYEIIEFEYEIYSYDSMVIDKVKPIKSAEYYEEFDQCLNDAILESLKQI